RPSTSSSRRPGCGTARPCPATSSPRAGRRRGTGRRWTRGCPPPPSSAAAWTGPGTPRRSARRGSAAPPPRPPAGRPARQRPADGRREDRRRRAPSAPRTPGAPRGRSPPRPRWTGAQSCERAGPVHSALRSSLLGSRQGARSVLLSRAETPHGTAAGQEPRRRARPVGLRPVAGAARRPGPFPLGRAGAGLARAVPRLALRHLSRSLGSPPSEHAAMTSTIGVLFGVAVAYLLLLFGVAYATERGLVPARLVRHPLTYALSLGVYATSWTYSGSVGFARTQGYAFLTIYLGVTLACLLVPVLWEPVLRLCREHQLTSLADLFAFRFQSQGAGVLVTVFMLAGNLPY